MRGQRAASTPRQRPSAPAARQAALTGRGGVVVMFGAALLGGLTARWFGVDVLAGAGFTAGCVLAALATRPADLLTLAVSPPLVFLVATALAVLATSAGDGSLLTSVSVGVLAALSTTAPWLFLGTILVLAITAPRGLVANARELRGKLVGSRLFEQEENENPVRWDESPARERPRLPHGEVD
ncbi:DUF6542 domain-containing protein [Actinomadura yumaensis]|uniref:DUF6542 domain-containing protein n=1 Tax=Actinomadura yumaensis TaxID=111807 RepID=A0ABW2C9D0_9ACTN